MNSPTRLNLTQLKLQAKELHRGHRAGAAEAFVRIKQHLPHLESPGHALSLSEAQLVIARENGFDSWPKLKLYIDSSAQTPLRICQEITD